MRRFLSTLLITSISTCATLQAANNPCCSPCPALCCGSFEASGAALLLGPSSCNFAHLIVDSRPFDAATHDAILPQGNEGGPDDYKWGFRLGVGYVPVGECADIQVEYTRWHNDFKGVGGPKAPGGIGFWPTRPHPRYVNDSPWYTTEATDTISAFSTFKQKLGLDIVELQFASRSKKTCNLALRTYMGVHYMNFDIRQQVFYEGSPDPAAISAVPVRFVDLKAQQQVWGVGPVTGIDAQYNIGCGFGVGGHFAAIFIAGFNNGSYKEIDRQLDDTTEVLNETANVKFSKVHSLSPHIRGALGINYGWACGECFKITVEVGYEYASYIHLIKLFGFNDQRGTTNVGCASVNLDGLYFKGKITI